MRGVEQNKEKNEEMYGNSRKNGKKDGRMKEEREKVKRRKRGIEGESQERKIN